MLKKTKNAKLCPTDLTWEEKNPSHYRFNNGALIKLEKTIEEIKNGKNNSKKEKKHHSSQREE
ncbi:unnamed protein product [marine sediment metagenome]|uniref:Uncharacterized protein n=1 Tax=marine sediment metagenome TaxID=412755 RepID=X1HH38_9ZZZZ